MNSNKRESSSNVGTGPSSATTGGSSYYDGSWEPGRTIATGNLYNHHATGPDQHSSSSHGDNTSSDVLLREEVMMSQFMSVAGCGKETARHLLSSAHWQWDAALSRFFCEGLSGAGVSGSSTSTGGCGIRSTAGLLAPMMGVSSSTHPPQSYHHHLMHAPANTPATPPNFPDALLALSKLSTN